MRRQSGLMARAPNAVSQLRGTGPAPWTPCGRQNQWLLVMVKEPRLGRVKTRLARDIGAVAATNFYRHAASAVLRRLANDPRWRVVLAVAPDHARRTPTFQRGTLRTGQGHGDLGDRMGRLAARMPPGPFVIVGTDIPAIAPQHVARAFQAARSAGVSFGPAPDGGFWMVGFRQTPRRLMPFAPVRWSSEHALADTVANLAAGHPTHGRSPALIDVLDDVDDGETFRSVRAWSGRVVRPQR